MQIDCIGCLTFHTRTTVKQGGRADMVSQRAGAFRAQRQ